MTIYTENYPDIYRLAGKEPVYVKDAVYHCVVMTMANRNGNRFNAYFSDIELTMMLNVIKQRKT